MRVRDLNWMQLEEYLRRDDRIVLPVGSTEQHAYLSLETDNIIAERLALEAAEPLGVPVLPVLAYGVTGFFMFPAARRSGPRRSARSSATSSSRCTARASAASSSPTGTAATRPTPRWRGRASTRTPP